MYIIEINIYSKKVYSQGEGNFTTNKGEAKQSRNEKQKAKRKKRMNKKEQKRQLEFNFLYD